MRARIVLALLLGFVAGGASCRTAQASTESMIERGVRALERIATALEQAKPIGRP